MSTLSVINQTKSVIKNPIRVLSVDEHPLMREGIASVINAQSDMRLVAHASSTHEAIQLSREHSPDVIVMEFRLRDMSGIDALIAIREQFPGVRIVVFTSFEGDMEIRRALAAGACSYLLKSSPPNDLPETIRQVHAGERRIPTEVAVRIAESFGQEPLSGREVQVLKLAMTGSRNREIGDRLFISEETVKAHMKRILVKLGANDRTQAVTIAARRGIIHF